MAEVSIEFQIIFLFWAGAWGGKAGRRARAARIQGPTDAAATITQIMAFLSTRATTDSKTGGVWVAAIDNFVRAAAERNFVTHKFDHAHSCSLPACAFLSNGGGGAAWDSRLRDVGGPDPVK